MGEDTIRVEDLVGLVDDDRGDVTVLFRPDGHILWVSRSCRAMTGWGPSSLVGRSGDEFIHVADQRDARSTRQVATGSRAPAVSNFRFRCADGTYLWVESLVKQVPHPAGPETAMLCSSIRDISDRKVIEARVEAEAAQREVIVQQLEQSERRLAEAQIIGGIGSWEYDLITDTLTWSEQFCRIYDHPVGAPLTSEQLLAMTHHEDRDHFSRIMLSAYERRTAFEMDHRVVLPDGAVRVVHTRGRFEVDRAGLPVTVRGTAQDVTEARTSEMALRVANDRLQQLATTDALTTLPNRALFDDRLGQALALARREDRKVAVLYLDLDRFKTVNDTVGHHGGDDLLVDVAARLSGAVREADTAARLGGDEFAVLLSGPDLPTHAAATAQRILDAFRYRFIANAIEVFATVSIGIALWPDDSDDEEDLLSHADTAMYRAKRAGGNRFKTYRSPTTKGRPQPSPPRSLA